jgi:hypothetical protein
MSRLTAASLLLSGAAAGCALYAWYTVRTHTAGVLRQLIAARNEAAGLRAELAECRRDRERRKWIPRDWHHSPEDF